MERGHGQTLESSAAGGIVGVLPHARKHTHTHAYLRFVDLGVTTETDRTGLVNPTPWGNRCDVLTL